MSYLFAKLYCSYNALVFFVLAAASGYICTQAEGVPALVAAGAAGVSSLCGLANLTGARLMARAGKRQLAETVSDEAPALTPGQMLANQRWSRRA
jgi:hypothetical protein